MTNYTAGQGSTFKVNPLWYGPKPKLKEVDFKIITDTTPRFRQCVAVKSTRSTRRSGSTCFR